MSAVRFPHMSDDGAKTGVLSTWYVASGETVSARQLLGDAAMDKVDAEILAPSDGIITLTVEEGAELAQGAEVATIADA